MISLPTHSYGTHGNLICSIIWIFSDVTVNRTERVLARSGGLRT